MGDEVGRVGVNAPVHEHLAHARDLDVLDALSVAVFKVAVPVLADAHVGEENEDYLHDRRQQNPLGYVASVEGDTELPERRAFSMHSAAAGTLGRAGDSECGVRFGRGQDGEGGGHDVGGVRAG